ncbi:MAG: hypothetical protein PGN08_05820 [Sphingomonas taxi]
MPQAADTEFYIRRERQERALADRACSAEGRRLHLEMASRYARLIGEAQDTPHPPMRLRAT